MAFQNLPGFGHVVLLLGHTRHVSVALATYESALACTRSLATRLSPPIVPPLRAASPHPLSSPRLRFQPEQPRPLKSSYPRPE